MVKKYEQYIKENKIEEIRASKPTPFSDFDRTNRYDVGEDKRDNVVKHHMEWSKQFPILKKLELESDYLHKTRENIWIYTLINNKDNYNLFLEIQQKDTWSISLEIELSSDDIDYNKSFDKSGLTYEQLNIYLRRASIYIEEWCEMIKDEFGIKVFPDSE
jgi:hypothetical protein